MKYFVASLILLVSLTDAQLQKVNVTVYYESLCPYAKKFIVEQLHPTLEGNLSTYVNLELVPYGKTVINTAATPVTFTCNHGESECYGNQIQACTQNLTDIGNKPRDLSVNKHRLGFLSCFMGNLTLKAKKEDVNSAIDRCVSKAHNFTAVQLKVCADGESGISEITKNGKRTDDFQNPLKHVPTIIYNGAFNQTDSDESEKDFRKVLCSKITGAKPVDCTINTNATTISPIPASSTHLATNAQLLVVVSLMLLFPTFVLKM